MANSNKRYPSQDLYKAIHDFFNKEARDFPGNKYSFEEVFTEIGYVFKPNGDVITPTKTYTSRKICVQRWYEVRDDINTRLEKHGITWKMKEGRGQGSKYCYEEPVPYDFPKECQDEKTLYDLDLLKDVIGYTQTPLSNKAVKRDIISFSTSDLLGNVDLVKELFLAIRDKKVVEFTYNAAYSNHPKRHVLSPHYLKEYNLRWFLFGHTEEVTDPDNPDVSADSKPREGYYTFAIDRIDDDGIKIREDLPYHDSDTIKDYSAWFDDIVGVTHETGHEEEPVDIDITTFDPYTHSRIMAKPFHKSQVEISPATKENPGHIRLHLCVNQELKSQLLSFGDSIVARWKGKSYEDFLKRVNRMHDRYNAK